MVKIEKNVAIPSTGGRSRYPWAKMSIGDSFTTNVTVRVMSSQACHAAKKTGFKFACRTDPLDKSRVRVWRIE